MDELKNQPCLACGKKTCTLREHSQEIPYFGNIFIMSMDCESCGYHKADVESEEEREPVKLTFEVKNSEDLNVRVVKSGNADIKMPTLRMSVEAGPGSNGYITNVEGLLNRFENIVKQARDSAEEAKDRKSAKNLLKKIWKIKEGEQELKIVIEDPSGNSAIISDKTKIEKLKVKK